MLYPRVFAAEITKERSDDWKKNHISFPYVCMGLSVLILFSAGSIIEIQNELYAFFIGVLFWLVLAGIYLACVWKRGRDKSVMTAVLLYLVFYVFVSFSSYMRITTIAEPEHETVIVLSMQSSHSRYTSSYEADLQEENGEQINMEISHGLYKEIQEGDTVRICKNQTLSGVKYWRVHL